MSKWSTIFGHLVVVVSLLSISTVCCAQQGEANLDLDAQTRFDAANHYFEDGDYEHALEEFQAAFGLSARPALLYNISLCYERIGNLTQAIQYLERYGHTLNPGEERTHVEVRLNHMYERLHEQTERESSGDSHVTVDVTRTSAAPRPILPSATENAATQPDHSDRTTLGLALASTVTAAISLSFGALAWHQHATLPAPCADGCGSRARSRLKAYDLTADIALLLSVGSAVAALVSRLRHGNSGTEPSARVDVALSSRAALLVMERSF